LLYFPKDDNKKMLFCIVLKEEKRGRGHNKETRKQKVKEKCNMKKTHCA
jgi:hypothetical protein